MNSETPTPTRVATGAPRTVRAVPPKMALPAQFRHAANEALLDVILSEKFVVSLEDPHRPTFREMLGRRPRFEKEVWEPLFSELKERDVLPVLVRLDFGSRVPFRDQILAALADEADAAKVEMSEEWQGNTLWERLHNQNFALLSRRNRLMLPLLVFDAFEEVLVLRRQHQAAAEAFLRELADLAEGRVPAELFSRLKEQPSAARELSFHQHPYKILLCLREDYLSELEELRGSMPSMVLNRPSLPRAQRTPQERRLRQFRIAAAGFASGLTIVGLLALWAVAAQKGERQAQANAYAAQKGERQARANAYLGKSREQMAPRAALAYLAAAVRTDHNNALARGSLVKELLQRSWLPNIAEIRQKPLALSPGGRFLATAPDKSSVQLWDLRSRRPVGSAIHLSAAPSDVQLSLDGRKLLTLQEGMFRLWETGAGGLVGSRGDLGDADVILSPRGDRAALLTDHGIRLWQPGVLPDRLLSRNSSLRRVRFSPDGRLLAGFGWDLNARRGRAEVWETESGRRVASLSPSSLDWLDFSPDGRRLVTITGRTAQLWDVSSSQLLGALQPPESRSLLEARFAPDGRRLVTLSREAAWLWDLERMTRLRIVGGEGTHSIEMSPDGRWLLTVSNAQIGIWDTRSGKLLDERLPGSSGAFVPATPFAVTLSQDRARLWQIKPGTVPREVDFSQRPLPVPLVLGGDHLVVTDGTTVQIRSFQTREITQKLPDAPAEIRSGSSLSLQTSSDGTFMSAATRLGIQVWNVAARRLAGPLLGDADYYYYALSPDGQWIVVFRGSELLVHEVATGRLIGRLSHKGIVDSFGFGQGSNRIVTTSGDSVYVWDVQTGQLTAGPWRAGTSPITESAAMSPDGKWIAVGGTDGQAWILDTDSGRVVAGPLEHGEDPVGLVQFCAAGQTLLTAAVSTVRFWDVETGSQLRAPLKTDDWIRLARRSPDGLRMLVVAGSKAWLLDAATGRLISGSLEMEDLIEDAGFSRDGQSIRAVSRTRVTVLDLPLPPPGEATELAGFAEAVAGLTLDDESRLVELPNPSTRFETLVRKSAGARDEDSVGSLVRRFFSPLQDQKLVGGFE